MKSVRLCCYSLAAVLAVGGLSCSRDPNVVKVKYLENGNRYFEKGRYQEARIMYRNALKKDPRYAEAYYRLGLTDLKMKRPLEASRDFRRAIDTDPKHQGARAQLGELYLLAYLSRSPGWENLPAMIQSLSDELLKLNSKSVEGLRLKGFYELSQKQLPEATATFRRANELSPGKPEVALPLAQTLYAAGKNEEAEKLARDLIEKEKTFGPVYDLLYVQAMRAKRMAEAESILKLKVANNPNVADYLLQLARFYYTQQRPADMQRVVEKVGSKEFPDGRAKAGMFYYSIRDFDSAVRQYEAGIQEDPQRKAQYQKAIAEILVIRRRPADAIRMLEQVLQENRDDDQAQAMRASLMIETGDPKQVQAAITDLQAVISRMPANAVLRFNLGRALQFKGQLDQARTQYVESARLQKNLIPPRLALAQLDYYRRDWGHTLEYSNEVLQLDPRNLPARLLRSSALAAVGNFTQARKDLADTTKLFPSSREAQIQIALLDLTERRYADAETAFRKLYQEAPEDLRSLMGLAETYARQAQYQKAIQVLSTEAARQPGRPEIQLALGNLAFRSKQYDLAIEHYQALVKANPEAGEVYYRLGEAYRVKGDFKEAVKAFRTAKDLRPNDAAPALQLALLLHNAGQIEQARPIYEQILKIQPDNPVALNNLAYLMAEDGQDLDEALKLAQRAKQRLPDNLDVSDTLGWIYIKKNLADNAVDLYQDLVAKSPDRSTYRYHLAIALYQRGDRVRARRELQIALQKKPSPDEETKIKALLGKLG
jgi:tetratricopeptide (TPR) repeat protein